MIDKTMLTAKYGSVVTDRYCALWEELEAKFPDEFSKISRLKPADLSIKSKTILHTRSAPTYTGPRQVFTHDSTDDLSKFPLPTPGTLLTVVLDIDQTLLNGVFRPGIDALIDPVIDPITDPIPSSTRIELYQRPFARELIKKLTNIPHVRVVVWTAATPKHALTSLEFLDPENNITLVICRDENATQANWAPLDLDSEERAKFVNTKVLEWIPGCDGNIVIFDDSKAHYPPIDVDHSRGSANVINISAFTAIDHESEEIDHTMILILFFVLYFIDQKRHRTTISAYDLLKESIARKLLRESYLYTDHVILSKKAFAFDPFFITLFFDLINRKVYKTIPDIFQPFTRERTEDADPSSSARFSSSITSISSISSITSIDDKSRKLVTSLWKHTPQDPPPTKRRYSCAIV